MMMHRVLLLVLSVASLGHGMYPQPQQPYGYRPLQSSHVQPADDMMKMEDMPHKMMEHEAAPPASAYQYRAPFVAYHQQPAPYQPQPQSYPQPQPYSQYQYPQPEPAYPRPEPAYHQPEPAYHQPAAYARPEPAYARPEPAYARPEPAYARPEPAYARPEPAYQQPEPAYHQPATPYRYNQQPQQPFTAYHQPQPQNSYRPQQPQEPHMDMMDKDMMPPHAPAAPVTHVAPAGPAVAPAPAPQAAAPEPKYLGTFDNAKNKVEGDIFLLDDHTLYIQGFSFDGQAPDVFFWSDGVKIPYYTRSNPVIQEKVGVYNKEDIVLLLPPEKPTIKNLDHFKIWCQEYGVNFGEFHVGNSYY